MKEFFLDNAKKLVFFSVLFFCLFLMIYVLFSPLFCVLQGFSYDNYRHYVTNHQLNKKLVFFGRCILTFFFCNFQGQKMLAESSRASSCLVSEFFHHISPMKRPKFFFPKVVEEVFFRPRLLGKTEEEG